MRGAFAFDVQHAAVQPEAARSFDRQVYETFHLSMRVVRRTMQTGLLERRLGGRPVLRHAGEHAVALVHELACELDANDIHACYFDCRTSLQCFVELHSRTDRIVATFARWQQEHEEWDGQGAALRHHTSGT